ncbi:MAG: hypothetical protein APR55_04010 [Methanolinea sp. SDB]|nr:MAG: hypothetical protein APR55_04010 [Methanolinea sp. SDB]
MAANLPVLGDGSTHYYHQGPVFLDDPDPEIEEMLRWNPEEDVNVLEKDMGAIKGTNIKDLCDLVGGLNAGEVILVKAEDGLSRSFAYENVYGYSATEGPMVLTWYVDGLGLYPPESYPDTGYSDGMRLVWLADDSTNPFGVNAFGNWDWHEAADPVYYYYYQSGDELYPTTTGLSVKYVSDIHLLTDDPIPPPEADFSSSIPGDLITNGDFETGDFSGWTTENGTTIYTSTYKVGSYSARLMAPPGSPASIEQSVDLTDVDVISYWCKRYAYGELRIYIDDTQVAAYSDALDRQYETLEVSGYSGIKTVKFQSYATGTITNTLYLDEITDFGLGTTGYAPLTIQFVDESQYMEKGTGWEWDIDNDGTTDYTTKNPQHTYTSPGTYSVKLTVTNAGGSDTVVKTDYITVLAPETIDVDATGEIAGWDLTPNSDNVNNTAVDLSITTTASSWDVKVSDTSENPHKGHMSQWVEGTSWVTGGEYLATEMQVKAQSGDSYVGANSSAVILDESDGAGTYDLWFNQTTVPGDVSLTSGVYRVEITFTGSVN